MVKHLPTMWETRVQSLGWEDPLEKGTATHFSTLPGESHGHRSLVGHSHRVTKSQTRLSDWHFHFHWLLTHVISLQPCSDTKPELKNINYNSKAVRFNSNIDSFTFLAQLSPWWISSFIRSKWPQCSLFSENILKIQHFWLSREPSTKEKNYQNSLHEFFSILFPVLKQSRFCISISRWYFFF